LINIKKTLPTIALQHYTYTKLVDEIKLTNEIEGVHSTRKEIKAVLDAKNKIGKSLRLFNLVKKYEKLMTGDAITLDSAKDLRGLYDELVLPEVLAENADNQPDGLYFRKHSVFVQNDRQETVHFGIFPEERIIEAVSQTIGVLKNHSINCLIAISVLHYMIGYIHPFYDGNGRLNRFISSYLLANEFDVLVSYNLSSVIKENKKRYEKFFNITNDKLNKGDLTPFIINFLGFIDSAFRNVNLKLEEKREQLEHLTNKLLAVFDGKQFEIFSILLQNTLFGLEGLTIDELANYIKCSKTTVYDKLQKQPDFLRTVKDGHKNLYDLNLKYLTELE
jgi:Fic family protein